MARRRLHDEFFKKAKAEGYLARSAYKLLEINDKRKIIRKGDAVLDVGCAPGSWLQVSAELVGPRGVVVGIDLREVDHERAGLGKNICTMVGDANEIAPDDLLELRGGRLKDGGGGNRGGLFDVVLSDMAPDTTGFGDDFISERLCRTVLDLLPALLKVRGNLAMKVFEGAAYPPLFRDTAALFTSCKGLKPKATRDMSREIYIVGLGYKGPAR